MPAYCWCSKVNSHLSEEHLRIPHRDLIIEVRRLANAFTIEKSETPVKRLVRRAGLFEKIGVSPVAHTLQEALAGLQLGKNVGRADVRVVHDASDCERLLEWRGRFLSFMGTASRTVPELWVLLRKRDSD